MDRLIRRLETGQPVVRQELAAELDDIFDSLSPRCALAYAVD